MKSVSIIIPCYNEEESIPQLMEKLKELEAKISPKYIHHFIFVDDGSKDRTYPLLNENIKVLKSAKIIQHEKNQNLGAALKTGIKNIDQTDYIAFLDSDCTYEPNIILSLLEKLDDGFDLSTVSPYHPKGAVEGVPPWRLFLSKGLSTLYRVILHTKFFTYTAMVRAVKSDKANAILSERNDFSFVAESFIKAIRLKYSIIEIPTVLKIRKFGVSKMNIIRTIKSHLSIIGKLISGKEF